MADVVEQSFHRYQPVAQPQSHAATERYQDLGAREDAYAEPTDRYQDFHGALRCLFADAGFIVSSPRQRELFEGDEDVH